MTYKRLERQVLLAKTTEKRFRSHTRPSLSYYISDFAFLVLVWSQKNIMKLVLIMRYSKTPLGLQPSRPSVDEKRE